MYKLTHPPPAWLLRYSWSQSVDKPLLSWLLLFCHNFFNHLWSTLELVVETNSYLASKSNCSSTLLAPRVWAKLFISASSTIITATMAMTMTMALTMTMTNYHDHDQWPWLRLWEGPGPLPLTYITITTTSSKSLSKILHFHRNYHLNQSIINVITTTTVLFTTMQSSKTCISVRLRPLLT